MNNLVISDCLYGLVLARGRWIMHKGITNIKVQGYINPSSFVTYRCGFNFKCCLVTQSCPTLCDPVNAAHQASLSFTVSQSLLKSSPSSRRCHPTISSSVLPFSPCLPSFPASGSFPMSRLFTSGGQSIGTSAFLFSRARNFFSKLRIPSQQTNSHHSLNLNLEHCL